MNNALCLGPSTEPGVVFPAIVVTSRSWYTDIRSMEGLCVGDAVGNMVSGDCVGDDDGRRVVRAAIFRTRLFNVSDTYRVS